MIVTSGIADPSRRMLPRTANFPIADGCAPWLS